MDASQQLLLPGEDDSFSCAWLIDLKSSAAAAAAAKAVGDSQRSHDGAGSFIEIEPDCFFSIRWSTDEFDFGLPSPQCSAQVHADQIFSDGHLLPLRHDQPPSAGDAPSGPRLTKSQSVNSNRFDSPPQKTPRPATKSSSSSSSLLRSKSQKKITCKYLCFLMPLYKTVKDLRLLSSSSPSFSSSSSSSSSFKSANTGKDSGRSSPRTSDAMSSVDLCRGINSGISIDDAILHCKKSIGRGK